MARLDELRLITRVARIYYEQGLRQPESAAQLDLSQATISRLLTRADEEAIVRITIGTPVGVHSEFEERLQRTYALVTDQATARALLAL